MVTPLIFLLLFGIIEFGFLFKNYLAVVSSTRSGARMASAMPRHVDFAQEAANSVVREGSALQRDNIEELWVYKADKITGLPDGGSFDSCSTCVRFAVTGSDGAWVATETGGSWPADSQNACTSEADYVGVYVEYTNPGITSLIFDSIELADHSVMSLEPIPLTQGCKPA